jgi:hypothetical protein
MFVEEGGGGNQTYLYNRETRRSFEIIYVKGSLSAKIVIISYARGTS